MERIGKVSTRLEWRWFMVEGTGVMEIATNSTTLAEEEG